MRRRRWVAFGAVLATTLLWSCSNVRYVSRSLTGGAKVLLARQPIDRLLQDKIDLEPDLRRQLELILKLRRFAARRLLLPVGKSYGSYVDVGRPFVSWNVVAAPADSVDPKTWCFPIAGCVSYRGYFSEERAHRYAEKLRNEGWDVSVGGVTAYSTLGWFADPVLSTFVRLPRPALAALLFHELAHRRVYVPGDTAFNESFATWIEIIGQRQYLGSLEDGNRLVSASALARRHRREFVDLVLGARRCLDQLYSSDRPAAQLEKDKAQQFLVLKDRYRELREGWQLAGDGGPLFDEWFDGELNNAQIAAVGDYSIWLDAFAQLQRQSESLEDFYLRVEELAELESQKRQERLEALAPARQNAAYECVGSAI